MEWPGHNPGRPNRPWEHAAFIRPPISSLRESMPNTKHLVNTVPWSLFLITLGSFIFAFGAQGILVHQNFIMGGLYGTGLLIYYQTELLSPAIWYLLLNLPILILGWIFLSRRFFFYSLYGVLILSLFAQFITIELVIENQLYAAVAGGAICGTGAGVILRSRGSGGGLDIIAIILNRRYNLGIGKFFMIYNVFLFLVLFSQYHTDLVIASIILTFISSISLEQVLALFNQRKIVYILSDKHLEIINNLNQIMQQGATLLEARGAYSGRSKQMIMTVTNNLQLRRLENNVFDIDPDALFIVENSFNVIGSKFGKRKVY
jgi:uncharacterized membrane-anchored protein YitT (DUF2179 family)